MNDKASDNDNNNNSDDHYNENDISGDDDGSSDDMWRQWRGIGKICYSHVFCCFVIRKLVSYAREKRCTRALLLPDPVLSGRPDPTKRKRSGPIIYNK